MVTLRFRWLACIFVLLSHKTFADDETQVFDSRIAPLLARECLDCHNPTDKKGGLDLQTQEAAMRGGDSGAVLIPQRVEESLLWQRIAQGEMPPKRPLPVADRQWIKEWIGKGAIWGTSPIDTFRFSTEHRGGYDWWSFQPLRSSPPPASASLQNARSPIDAFLLQSLAQAGLDFSPRASWQALSRRLAFDFTGLPPDQEEVGDLSSPDDLERLTDRLLASPAFGERWARHWLDLAHFGESEGFEYDRLRPNAWRYRDWVINAFNRDLPYDEFARLQIAGDVLHADNPDAIIATGFLVGGAFDGLTPAGDVMRKIMRQDEIEDLVATVSQTFLGLTVHCARCHDHKFDPIRQFEYYQLSSALAGVKRGERDLPPPAKAAQLADELAALIQRLKALEQPARDAVRKEKLQTKVRQVTPSNEPPVAQPIATWEFDSDLSDSTGTLHCSAFGGARLENGALLLDGKSAYAATASLPKELAEKTLEAWVTVGDADQQGGGVFSVETTDGSLFDAIVYGEREPRRWMAGSNGFVRSESFRGPEFQWSQEPVQIVITYSHDGTITGYLQGQPYGSAYGTSLQRFDPSQSHVAFGIRHRPVGGNRMFAGAIHRAALYDRALSAIEVAATSRSAPWYVEETELSRQLTSEQRQERLDLQARIRAVGEQQVMTMTGGKAFAITPQTAPVVNNLIRGNPLQPADVVVPAGLKSLVGHDSDFGLPADAPDQERRRRLVQWLTAPTNPLFARTIVNRLWQYHFGQGLVATPNDLGFQGGVPSHPELLDWLAADLQGSIEQPRVYSLKKLHRRYVLSHAYQQQSRPRENALRVDAGNRLLWRKDPVRLDAESVRDAILVSADQLNRNVVGIGYQDFRPFLRGGTQFYEPLDPVGPEFQRRSIYRTWARGGHNQLLDTFDCPDPSTITPRRSITNTPLQALSLLNNSFVLRLADQFATRLIQEEPQHDGRRIQAAFALACGRPPQSRELEQAQEFVQQHGLPAFCRVLLNSNAFLYVE